MFYAVIYSFFLAFGITLGAAAYGWIDKNATSQTVCPNPLSDWYKFLFVPMFTIGLALVNQAKLSQLPIMTAISGGGYVVTLFINLKFSNTSQFASAIGAFVIGVLGNIYSRVGHGLAFAAMLPGIFVLVPSGIAAQGSLVAGIAVADNIVSNHTQTGSTTTGVQATSTLVSSVSDSVSNSSILYVGFSMIQVSIGITVGLFVGTLVVYPLGKKRSGLFTF